MKQSSVLTWGILREVEGITVLLKVENVSTYYGNIRALDKISLK